VAGFLDLTHRVGRPSSHRKFFLPLKRGLKPSPDAALFPLGSSALLFL